MAVTRKLSALGRTVAALENEALATRPRRPTHERLAAIQRAHAKRMAPGSRLAFGWPLALGGVLGAVLAVILLPRSAALDFVVGPSMQRGELGVWISAPAKEPRVIAFSDGSRVRLTAGAQARVVGTNERGARVVVERGTVHAEVVPRAGNDWWVVGGPFEIHVTGTRFDAEWEPERELLRVTMYEGQVNVRGGCLAQERVLANGDSAAISCPPATSPVATAVGRAAVTSTATARAPVPPAASSSAALAPATASASNGPSPQKALRESATKPPGSNAESSAAAPSWRAWVRLGGYKEALAAAENEGFDTLTATLSLSDLLELATTARLAGKTLRASEAYSAVRRRFAGSDGAATAAFHLGQLAFDGARSYSEAKRWFSTYLAERPSGALAAEALGRSLEAEQRMGDLAAARVTAGTYLQRYPKGAHARLAKSLLEP
jgi:TolA-binding protein